MKRWPGEITAGRVRHAYWTNSSIHDRTRRPQAYSHRSRGFEIDSTADVTRGQRSEDSRLCARLRRAREIGAWAGRRENNL